MGSARCWIRCLSENSLITPTTDTDTSGSGSLSGTWLKPCGSVDNTDPDSLYDIVEVTLTGSSFSSSILNYIDPSCSTLLSMAPNPTSSGTHTTGENFTTTGGLTATEMDTHITQFNGAPFDIDDYSLYYLDEDIVYFGDTEGFKDGSSNALRSDTIDFNRAFYRQ